MDITRIRITSFLSAQTKIISELLGFPSKRQYYLSGRPISLELDNRPVH